VLAILRITFPFFALIAAGYVCVARRWLAGDAVRALNSFVLFVALPCMLFKFSAGLDPETLWRQPFLPIYGVVGIVLFAIAIGLSWVQPYAFGLDAGGLYELVAHVPLTLLLLVSVFVLGGDFWDKLGALFRYRTKVAFPDDGASLGRHLP